MSQKVDELKKNLQEMTIAMGVFCVFMKSLYARKVVESNENVNMKFRKLRDDTRNDAMVYLNGNLPLSTKFVASISEYFEYYEALDYEEWAKNLKDILEKVCEYQQQCTALIKMHEEIMVTLKLREDVANLIVKEFKEVSNQFKMKKAELENEASRKSGTDLANAVAMGAKAKVQEAAAIIVSYKLIPVLQSFIEGLSAAADFLSVRELELHMLELSAKKNLENPKKIHYIVMKKRAKYMKAICQNFDAVLPFVRTDFEAIPKEETDWNYVDRCLEKHKKIIRETCTERVAAIMLNVFTR